MSTPAIPNAEYVSAKAALEAHASSPHFPLDTLFADWCRLRTASARQAPDSLTGVRFADVVEAVVTARSSGARLVWPVANVKGK